MSNQPVNGPSGSENHNNQNENLPDFDENRLAALLKAAASDVPAPDLELLVQLRQKTLEVFGKEITSSGDNIGAAAANNDLNAINLPNKTPASSVETENHPHDHPSTGNASAAQSTQVSHLFKTPTRSQHPLETAKPLVPQRLALRGLAALAAIAAVLVLGITVLIHNTASGAPRFADVLDQFREAKTVQLRLTGEGKSADVWIRSPGEVRAEESPQKYTIASGSRLWKVDEAANTASSGKSPWYRDEKQPIDLLKLLNVGIGDAGPLLSAEPAEKTEFAGRQCYVFRAELPADAALLAMNDSKSDGKEAAKAEGTDKSAGNSEAVKNAPNSSPVDRAPRKLMIEAYADAQTNQLQCITVRPVGVPRIGPPLAELQLVAVNTEIEQSKFLVAKSLTEDGRIGKVIDMQGLVVLRPALVERWTPIGSGLLLKTGDLIRTDVRGANAARLRMTSEVELTLGPGTLLECISPTQARVHTGEVQVIVPKAEAVKAAAGAPVAGAAAAGAQAEATFELLAPRTGSQKFAADAKQLWRVDRDDKLIEVKQQPIWLQGFDGTTNNESLGSLIATIDGRNEPLTIGFHKVKVDIRDQIARTTIEESFVNHTKGTLEGVFYFPLPADASISDFGMWIGNDLVEADIVEKQRAREIYETILREKRDPGLLEWTTGNLFKARVYPISANSEKRIKITYTQVLPLRDNRYRYSYGLRSELLTANPLRELSLSVQVNSALPLKSVTCPTHSVRTQQTEHSAQVDFAAQEYTPNRDFEVVCEIDNRGSDVVVVPHRRGTDGYFLLQLTPPGGEGNFQRELLPDGKPLDLVFLCDTSASMDAQKRKDQAEFVATALAALSPKDRFQLAATDVATVWVDPEAMSATPENIAKARDFLEHRVSLGWTNLDQAFVDVLKRAPAGAQVVYIGDGIVTAGNLDHTVEIDPADFVKRLARILADQKPADSGKANESASRVILHAVTVGNVYEQTVLNGIATLGHGSIRAIGGEQTPQLAAREWLTELVRPGLRDLQVHFDGVKVAAVYPDPDHLPQLPAGTQQILVGRYLPTGEDQHGEVIVTGTQGGEKVKYSARINLKDAEAGNSFIPRLWARRQLDFLLNQGQSPTIHEQIIALSEAFHIITPFTSLLVLESDADRERFGVKRHFEMRDGEQFFAEGRDNANFELRNQQMKLASNWRLGMRNQVLASLVSLGRNIQVVQQPVQVAQKHRLLESLSEEAAYPVGGPISFTGTSGVFRTPAAPMAMPSSAAPFGFNNGNGYLGDIDGDLGVYSSNRYSDIGGFAKSGGGSLALSGLNSFAGDTSINAGLIGGLDQSDRSFGGGGGFSGFEFQAEANRFNYAMDGKAEMLFDRYGPGFDGEKAEVTKSLNGLAWNYEVNDKEVGQQFAGDFISAGSMFSASTPVADMPFAGPMLMPMTTNAPVDMRGLGFISGKPMAARRAGLGGGFGGRGYYVPQPPDYVSWITTLFPAVPAPSYKPAVLKPPATWTAEAIAVAKSLIRTDALLKQTGGLEIRSQAEYFDPRWKRQTGHNSNLSLYGPTAWLTRSFDDGAQTIVNYCNDQERGAYSLALLLGTARKSYERDLKTPPLNLSDFSIQSLDEAYRGWIAKTEAAGDNQVRLILTQKNSTTEYRFTIDTA
ncbi:MAG TPA: VIT domain-containing protein, partial [Pirellulales bacterium]